MPFSDVEIKRRGIITEGFVDGSPPGVLSYGLTSYGYDARIGTRFKMLSLRGPVEIDPKSFNETICEDLFLFTEPGAVNPFIRIPPHSFVLGETVEVFRIPRDTLAICVGKSTYARCGIIVNVTPLEPEWEGRVTVEISNTTPLPARIYCNEGIMQVIFLRAEELCETSYLDKKGKYQGQRGITFPLNTRSK